MSQDDTAFEREQLRQAMAAQERLRGVLDDAVIEATIAALGEKLAALESRAQPAQQRKLASVLFLDIVGSTAMVRDLDPEESLNLLDTALQCLAQPIAAHGGHVTRFMGDGFLAVFGQQRARENEPEMAIRAALDILAVAAAHALELEATRSLSGFAVRMGIHSGWIVIGGQTEGADTLGGPAVNLAARLESAAQPGTMLISHDAMLQVRGRFDCLPREPLRVKGFDRPVRAYQVLRRLPFSSREHPRAIEGVATRMIGREAELSSLPYGLWRSLLGEYLDIRDDETPATARQKLTVGFDAVLGNAAESALRARLVGYLLGIGFEADSVPRGVRDDPQQLRSRSLSYLADFLRAAGRPLLIFFEDLHWADSSSLEAYVVISRTLAQHPVFFVGAARPELFEQHPRWLVGVDCQKRLTLNPLTAQGGKELLDQALRNVDAVPAGLSTLLHEQSAGNPFYVEELIMMLIDEGVIVVGERHWQVHEEKLERLRLPPTLTGILQARIDGLPAPERVLLQQAAVVGRVFWDAALAYLNRRQASTGDRIGGIHMLQALQERELVFRQSLSLLVNSDEYAFRHALLWEVTYESVLRRDRATYHADVADWLVERHREGAAEISGLIANHLERAGRAAEAVGYWREAAERAAARFANEEAVGFFRRAHALSTPDRQRDLLAQIGRLLILLGRHGEAEHCFRDALALPGKSDALSRSQLWLGVANSLSSQQAYCAAEDDYIRALALLEAARIGDLAAWNELWIEIQLARGDNAYLRADLDQLDALRPMLEERVRQWGTARQQSEFFAFSYRAGLRASRFWADPQTVDYARKSLEMALELESDRLIGDRLLGLGFTLLWAHRPDEAVGYLERGVALSRRIGDVPLQDRCLAYLCVAHRFRGDLAQTTRWIGEALESAGEEDNTLYIAVALANQAWLDYRHGRLSEALTRATEALNTWLDLGATYPLIWLADWIVLAIAARQGRLRDGVDAARRMLDDRRQRLPDPVTRALERVASADEARLAPALDEAVSLAHQWGFL